MPVSDGYHSRGYLPHIKVTDAAYFVTFRLADSLPREVVLKLKERRDDLVRREKKAAGESAQRRAELFKWHAAELDAVLDQNLGAAWLHDPKLADLVGTSLMHFSNQRYLLHAWCVMPNHVHAVVRPLEGHTLDSILHSWKSFTSHAANRIIARQGLFWQRESYDHWIRDDAEFAHCCSYTENNPVKAGLCLRAHEWTWSSAKTAKV